MKDNTLLQGHRQVYIQFQLSKPRASYIVCRRYLWKLCFKADLLLFPELRLGVSSRGQAAIMQECKIRQPCKSAKVQSADERALTATYKLLLGSQSKLQIILAPNILIQHFWTGKGTRWQLPAIIIAYLDSLQLKGHQLNFITNQSKCKSKIAKSHIIMRHSWCYHDSCPKSNSL